MEDKKDEVFTFGFFGVIFFIIGLFLFAGSGPYFAGFYAAIAFWLLGSGFLIVGYKKEKSLKSND